MEGGHFNAVKLLIEKGANLSVPNVFGVSAFIGFSKMGKEELVEIGIENGVDVNQRFRDETKEHEAYSDTPLEGAVKRGHAPVVELLLSSGANVSVKTPDGRSLVYIAKKRGFSDIVEQLQKCERVECFHNEASE